MDLTGLKVKCSNIFNGYSRFNSYRSRKRVDARKGISLFLVCYIKDKFSNSNNNGHNVARVVPNGSSQGRYGDASGK